MPPRIAKISNFNAQNAPGAALTKNGLSVKQLVGFGQEETTTTNSRNHMNTSNTANKTNTSGRAGSSFRQKLGNMFRPSSRQKHSNQNSLADMPLSPGGVFGRRSTQTLTTINSNQENNNLNMAAGKGV